MWIKYLINFCYPHINSPSPSKSFSQNSSHIRIPGCGKHTHSFHATANQFVTLCNWFSSCSTQRVLKPFGGTPRLCFEVSKLLVQKARLQTIIKSVGKLSERFRIFCLSTWNEEDILEGWQHKMIASHTWCPPMFELHVPQNIYMQFITMQLFQYMQTC